MSREGALQELPSMNTNFEGSMLSNSQKKRKAKKRGCCYGEDSENTPNELLIQEWSPPQKCPRVKGKENLGTQFVLARRSRRRIESTSGFSWDSLPDELLLRVLRCLPLQQLVRVSGVCKRWNRLTHDESLWHSVDLVGMTHISPALEKVLTTGVRRLRCPRTLIEELHLTEESSLRLQQLDLSSCTVTPPALEDIVSRCTRLQCLSLEGLLLSDSVVRSLAQNSDMLQLDLCGCSGFSADALGHMLKALPRIKQLNISWCGFSNEHVKAVVSNIHPTVTMLNLGGYRENLTMEDLRTLVDRCPNIKVLDLSDSVLLTTESFPILEQLKALVHLSLSRCYQIHAASLADFSERFPALRLLDVFGLVQESCLRTLKKGLPRLTINTRPFSFIARPTPALLGDDRMMWDTGFRLRFKS